jgi:ATP-dependent Lhr-like helicase
MTDTITADTPASRRLEAQRAVVRAEVLLDRYGLVSRASVGAVDLPGGFAAVYRVLALAEERGQVRRGYFVDGLGGSQFATAGAVDRLRQGVRQLDKSGHHVTARLGNVAQHGGLEAGQAAGAGDEPALLLAAADPANPYGAALPWPEGGDHQPARKAGALVVLIDGELAAFVEPGGRTVLTWTLRPQSLRAVAQALADAVHDGRVGSFTVTTIDGQAVLAPTAGVDRSPLSPALERAGFVLGPRGLRLRR